MRYLPVFLDVQGRRVLVVGAGEVADRKLAALRRAGAEPVQTDRFAPDQLEDCVLAIGADAPEPDLEALSAAARARNLPVNVVDRPQLCSFITPAVVDREPLIVAIGSAGEAPVLARLVRARIEALLPPALSRLGALAGSLSAELRQRFPAPAIRRRVLERMLDGPAAERILAGDEAAGLQLMRAEIEGGATNPPGAVAFVAAGPGPADLLTLRGQRLLGEADTVMSDPTVSPEVIDLSRRDARQITAGLDQAHELRRLARAGERVVRLSRTIDQALQAQLAAEGIATQAVPGVTDNP